MVTSKEEELALLVADVFELAGALRRSGDTMAAPSGQTQARWQVLSVVSEGDWTVSDAARRLGISRQAVQRVADALAADGLVRYGPNPAHTRAPLVRLTGAGRRALAAITDNAQARNREVVAGIPRSDLVHARELLRTLIERTAPPPS